MSAVFSTQFQAWSCEFSLELIECNCDPKVIVDEIKNTLTAYEQIFSRFKPESLVSQLNQGKTIARTEVFEHVLEKAKILSQELSPKYFNPHVDLESHGYKYSFEKQSFETPKNTSSTTKQFPEGVDTNSETIQLKPNTTIDFGAFLKGYLAEKIAEKYKHCCRGLIVNFGGDLSVRGKDVHTDHFPIGIYNPITRQDEIVLLKNQSLSTSGTYKRKWSAEGKTQHHILDPETNNSSKSDFISISFIGDDGALCDALCTAAFNAPPSVWETWREQQESFEYLAITESGAVKTSSDLLQQ